MKIVNLQGTITIRIFVFDVVFVFSFISFPNEENA